ncbi:MAG: hypothetical protein ACREKQ_17285 [Candidatus Rokuibacteriota bacterium]
MADDFVYVGTHGPEDPTRATLVFAAAIGMAKYLQDHGKAVTVKVALLGQGILLMQDKIAESIRVVGSREQHSVLDLMVAARARGVEIHC